MKDNIIWNTPQFLRTRPGYRYYDESLLPSNIREEEDALVLEMVVPGVKREQIKLHVDEENCLEVQVENPSRDVSENNEDSDKLLQYLRHEFDLKSDHLERRFRLGKGLDLETIEASLEDGILTVQIGKKIAEKRSIAIA